MKDADKYFPWDRPSRSLGSTRPSLVEGLQKGDQDDWERCVTIYGPVAYHFYLSMVRDREDRMDIWVEVFKTARKKIKEFQKDPDRPSFRPWLRQICYFKVGDYIHRSRVKPREVAIGGDDAVEMFAQLADPAAATDDPGVKDPDCAPTEGAWRDRVDGREKTIQDVVFKRILDVIREELAAHPRTWELAMRQIIGNESADVVARELNTTCTAAYTAKSRVMKRAREILKEFGEPGVE